MKMLLHRLDLELEHEFTISRGSISHQPSLVVELQQSGISGFGEVTANSYYGHTIESMTDVLESVFPRLDTRVEKLDQRDWPSRLWDQAIEHLDGNRFALSALDIAAHDLAARRQQIPLYRLWDLDWGQVPPSSYTIGLAPIDSMIAKLQQRPDWDIYKIKLGTSDDLAIVAALREHTAATFRVDANCGWTVDQTVTNSKALKKLNVQFIEQPLPVAASDADKQRIFHDSALPLIADEDCQIEADVERCQGRFHGVNIKLCKCGGLTPAVRMLRRAKQLGLKTMVGCMIESSIGISAAAQLLPLLDYADLDGAVLLKDDPAIGVDVVNGHVQLTGENGTGARLRHD